MEEYLSSIRQCFELFSDTVKKQIKKETSVKLHYGSIAINDMTVEQISADANVLYMGYIVSSAYTINKESYICIAYKQLMSMVNEYSNIFQRNYTMEYLKDEKRRLEKEVAGLKAENERLLCMRDLLEDDKKIDNTNGKKGWFV